MDKIFRCSVYYQGKLIVSEDIEGTEDEERMIDENFRAGFIDWLEFETCELDKKGNPKIIKIKR